ncbi:ribosomal protein S18 acetylase RimI-like enzyme [Clostridium tetanomorphum]|uniref:GNAT family N-acetyltransferase n=1 Tax=Clostridium tetanomorphum TaxID=1553 RepID=A0A923E6B5_CLOTT|nr:GNAT family N-acetyltransferase [Clostridium tetanomorphum]KAJ53793.1 hypothetical protein CTM_00950 [Clostridium tetanomorphum DSM 665]MBC2397307.1 GNAT family N-acetyltransferase [Clostridium tetanomorphum]MBP1862526.1 ribosomal protein S18 acetylase RimI-like enzyme [Clostridium tetanomorphum]NRS85633.1 ribosomal protein S18 acetylase RimI-like enzyme [Clostridium tetanomorphum]NRZ96356.1 ribosomal protein S18 acetylase RimI-like enzyme [Clostridium tetanomorphum]
MLDVSIDFEDINIMNVEKEDISFMQEWINYQSSYMEQNIVNPMKFDELYERFLEYYISESEFFLKIIKNNELIGVIKGRLEFKTVIEVWVGCFLIDKDMRYKGIGSKILKEFIDYLIKEYNVKKFFATVMAKSHDTIKFWKKNNYEILRISKNYYNIDGEESDMIILKRVGGFYG